MFTLYHVTVSLCGNNDNYCHRLLSIYNVTDTNSTFASQPQSQCDFRFYVKRSFPKRHLIENRDCPLHGQQQHLLACHHMHDSTVVLFCVYLCSKILSLEAECHGNVSLIGFSFHRVKIIGGNMHYHQNLQSLFFKLKILEENILTKIA